ncbi:MAG: hypothetical protein IT375_08215 [Polyangiaceae bacterium]|jgi:hypothetical protein|nr:hypothetical protein [Polyangiaceae bacterium]MCK6531768.1 hypothetical protein [Polyangiaceae bacterium]
MKLVAPIALSLALFPAAAAAAPCDHQAPAREVCVERDIFLMPGVQAVFFAPSGAAAPFFGGGAQIAPIHWSHNNDRFGPSQGALFLQASILESPESASSLAIYDLGFSLSLEKNASRRFLIPFFGATVGGTIHEELKNTGFAQPFAGLHLYWHHNLVLNAEGGYHFPFAAVDELRGPRAQVVARFSMW